MPLSVHRVRPSRQTPRKHGDKPPIAGVFLHGYGAPGDDLIGLADGLQAAGAELFFPEAPLDVGFGRAWWPIDFAARERARALGKDRAREVPEGLAAARAALSETLDGIGRQLPEHRLVLGGFSQGAMLTMDLVLRDPRPLAGIVLLSGTILAEAEWRERLPSRRGLPVFQSHGEADDILPYASAERLHALLVEAGLEATFHPFLAGHGIPPSILTALDAWLRAVADRG